MAILPVFRGKKSAPSGILKLFYVAYARAQGRGAIISIKGLKCVHLVFTFRNLPGFFFCDTPLLFRPHLGHQTTHAECPCGFLQYEALLRLCCGFVMALSRGPHANPPHHRSRYNADTTKDPASFDTGSFSKINRR